jgi:hypothetical protein
VTPAGRDDDGRGIHSLDPPRTVVSGGPARV